MPRVTDILPPTTGAIPPKPSARFEIPPEDGNGEPEEVIHEGPVMASPEEMRPLTILILGLICKVAKGDEPTEREIDLVNPPATAVANKYNVSNRWTAEIALFGSIFLVVSSSRRRMAAKRANEPQPTPDRADDPLADYAEIVP